VFLLLLTLSALDTYNNGGGTATLMLVYISYIVAIFSLSCLKRVSNVVVSSSYCYKANCYFSSIDSAVLGPVIIPTAERHVECHFSRLSRKIQVRCNNIEKTLNNMQSCHFYGVLSLRVGSIWDAIGLV